MATSFRGVPHVYRYRHDPAIAGDQRSSVELDEASSPPRAPRKFLMVDAGRRNRAYRGISAMYCILRDAGSARTMSPLSTSAVVR